MPSAPAQTVPRPGSQASEGSRVSTGFHVHLQQETRVSDNRIKLGEWDRQPSNKEEGGQEERMERR